MPTLRGNAVTPQEWMDRQRSVPDGDPDDGLEPAVFAREEDPVLFDAIELYLEARDVFVDAARDVANEMYDRGWSPI